jgi:hypothetical protein
MIFSYIFLQTDWHCHSQLITLLFDGVPKDHLERKDESGFANRA